VPLRVRCLIWDKDLNKSNDFVGACEVRIAALTGDIRNRKISLGARAKEVDKLTSGSKKPKLSCSWAITPCRPPAFVVSAGEPTVGGYVALPEVN